MMGQGPLGSLALGQPEELVTTTPLPAEACVWFTQGSETDVLIEVGQIIEDIEG
jgi:hypothetical protein